MITRRASWIAVSVLTVAMVASPMPTVVAQESQIRAVVDAWPTLLDDGDVDRLMDLFVADLVFAHPRYPCIVGKDSMRAFAEQVFQQQYSAGSTIRVEKIQVSGDWAHVAARFETTWTPRNGGSPFKESARYLWVLRHDAIGAWRVKSFAFYPISG